MRQFKNFCVFAAALGMVSGSIMLAALCFRRPETAVWLGGVLLPCIAVVFLAYRALLRLAPRYIAGRWLDKSRKNGGLAWITKYDGNEDLWLEMETGENAGEENGAFAVFAILERRKGLERLFLSADRKRLRACGMESGARVWVCVLAADGFRRVWLLGTLELAEEEGAACVAVQKGKLSGSAGKYFFEAAGR